MKKRLTLTDLHALVDVRADEALLFGWVLLYTLCATTTDLLINTAAYALFLSRFDARLLPYIYIGVSIGSVLTSTLYLKLSQRYSLAQLLLGMHLVLLLVLIGYRVGLGLTAAQWLLFSLPIGHGILNILLYLAFWNLVGRLFNLQQGKRLFGLFGAGQQVANLTIGLLIPTLVLGIGAANLLLAATCAGGGALFCLLTIARSAPGLRHHEVETPATATESPAPNPSLVRDPYIRLIFGMFILTALGSYFVDNLFYNRLESYYPNAEQLASFLGLFNGVLGGLSLFSQLFIANRLLNRYGVRTVVLLTPVILLLPTLLFVLSGAVWGLLPLHFWLAVTMNLTMQMLSDNDNTAANLLYQPLPATLRTHTQTIADGIVSPAAVGLTGVLLLILTNVLHFNALQLSYVLLPLLVGWVGAGRLLGRGYGTQVQQALRQRTIQGVQSFQPDRAGLDIIQQALRDPHPGAVLYAVEVLAANDRTTLARCLPDLLTYPHVEVRLAALARLERLDAEPASPVGEATTLAAIYGCWQHDPDPVVRSAALQAVATLGGGAYIDLLYDCLDAPEQATRRSVMIGFLRSGALEAILAAGERLTHLLHSAIPAERMMATQILGESGVAGFYRPLLTLLRDPDVEVQRAAVQAAGKLQHPKLWPALLAALTVPATRAAARAALLASGDALIPTLQTLLTEQSPLEPGNPHTTPQLQGELVRICGRIGERTGHLQAVALLLGQLAHPALLVRTRALQALVQCDYQVDATGQLVIDAHLQSEWAFAAWTLAGLVDLAETPTLAPVDRLHITLVRRALLESLRQQKGRLYGWFTLLYGQATLLRVRDAFGASTGLHRQPSPEQLAYLLETLDLSLAKRYTKLLLPLLDALTPAQQQARLGGDFPEPALSYQQRLFAIVSSSSPWVSTWLRTVALYTSVRLGATGADAVALHRAAATLVPAPDVLLRQTAVWVLQQLTSSATITVADANQLVNTTKTGDNAMLLTIEKVIILRTVDLFADTPDEILGEIAALLKEIEAPAGATIFQQGEQGDSMYIIVEGLVEALDGDHVFTQMGERQVFGEMALLDGEPRTATIRTVQPSRLLRLDQEPFYELMEDRLEIARGVIHMLLQRLRARTNDVIRLQAQVNAKPHAATSAADK